MGFQLMLILGLLGMYFDAAEVFVTIQTLLLRLAVAILWKAYYSILHYLKSAAFTIRIYTNAAHTVSQIFEEK